MRRTTLPSFAVLATCLVGALPSPAGAQATGDAACLTCHDEPEFLRSQSGSASEARELRVRPGPLRSSSHGEMTCAECHTRFERYPHPERSETITCGTSSCHDADPHPEWEGSVHARVQDDDAMAAAECADCHGIHDVAWLEDLQVEGGPEQQRMNAQCISCHQEQSWHAADPHLDSASCAGCHAPHATREAAAPDSWVAPLNQAATCGACHEEVADSVKTDVHGQTLLEQGRAALLAWPPEPADSLAPTCTDCHGAHPMPGPEGEGFQERMIDRCATCHVDYAETYYDTYHGKATRLGSGVSASCAQCHGAHGVFPGDSARSAIHADNLVETCGECHDEARPAFVLYDSHPEPRNRDRNPVLYYAFLFMNTILIGTLVVFGLHTALWWLRIWLDERAGKGHGSAHGGHRA